MSQTLMSHVTGLEMIVKGQPTDASMTVTFLKMTVCKQRDPTFKLPGVKTTDAKLAVCADHTIQSYGRFNATAAPAAVVKGPVKGAPSRRLLSTIAKGNKGKKNTATTAKDANTATTAKGAKTATTAKGAKSPQVSLRPQRRQRQTIQAQKSTDPSCCEV